MNRLFPFLLLLLTSAAVAAQAGRPNIVIMLVDDMGVMDSSLPFLTDAAGRPQRHPLNDFYRTPNMERLAARGVRFSQFYAMSVCSPTRIAIMTGQNAARHRTTNWINPNTDNAGPNGAPEWNWRGLKRGDVTLPALLRGGGYRTIHVGKGHFGPRGSEGADPSNLGFDVNVGGAAIGQPGSYYGKLNFAGKGKREANAVPNLAKYHGQDIFLTEALTLEAKAHVSAAVEARQPFFLYFAQYAVHAPFEADPRFVGNYRNSGRPEQAQAFASLVEGMDKSLGDLLDHLEALGIADNTLVIFLGDNGSDAPLGDPHAVACAAPLRGRKGAHYEGGMRVPFIAAWGKASAANPHQQRLPIPAGAIQTQTGAVQDLFPTVLAAAGVTPPSAHPVDGLPLAALFGGRRDPARPETFLMHYPHAPHRSDYWTTYRDGAWKVIYHYFPSAASENSHYQLFNLAEDPYEQRNVVATAPAELRRMMQGMIGELNRHAAVYPVDPVTRQTLRPKQP